MSLSNRHQYYIASHESHSLQKLFLFQLQMEEVKDGTDVLSITRSQVMRLLQALDSPNGMEEMAEIFRGPTPCFFGEPFRRAASVTRKPVSPLVMEKVNGHLGNFIRFLKMTYLPLRRGTLGNDPELFARLEMNFNLWLLPALNSVKCYTFEDTLIGVHTIAATMHLICLQELARTDPAARYNNPPLSDYYPQVSKCAMECMANAQVSYNNLVGLRVSAITTCDSKESEISPGVWKFSVTWCDYNLEYAYEVSTVQRGDNSWTNGSPDTLLFQTQLDKASHKIRALAYLDDSVFSPKKTISTWQVLMKNPFPYLA